MTWIVTVVVWLVTGATGFAFSRWLVACKSSKDSHQVGSQAPAWLERHQRLHTHASLATKRQSIDGSRRVVRRETLKLHLSPHFMFNALSSVQAAILDMLIRPLQKAVEETGISEVAIAGGVSANSGLRQRLAQASEDKGWTVHIPPMAYCTDNAAMIAAVGWLDAVEQRSGTLADAPSPRLPELVSLASKEA